MLNTAQPGTIRVLHSLPLVIWMKPWQLSTRQQPLLDRPVADILLDRVDADEIVDLVAVAAVLARRRADAAHDGGKRIGLDHAVEGVLLPRHAGDRRLVHAARDGEPAADVVARRAAALARRRAMHVGRALVGVVGLEDLGRQVVPFPGRLAVLEAAETSAWSDRQRRSSPSSPQDAVKAAHVVPRRVPRPASNRSA